MVRETRPLAELPVNGFTDAKTNYSKSKNKIQHFFDAAQSGRLCYKDAAQSGRLCYKDDNLRYISKIHAEQILSDIGRKSGNSSTSVVRNYKSVVKIRIGSAKNTERMFL